MRTPHTIRKGDSPRLMKQPCITSIRSHYPHLSNKEKMIADYILKNPQNIIHSSINQVADDLGVADSTVFRFCKRIGFKGYQAMKIALASEVVEPIKNIHEQISRDDDTKMITEKVFRSSVQALEDTLTVLDFEEVEKAVQMILSSSHIHLFGSGGSSVIAQDAYHKLIRTGLRVSVTMDAHMQLMSASQLREEDCAIFISHSGSTKDILDMFTIAKDRGAKTIAITGFSKSPLSEKADVQLCTLSRETEFRTEAMSSRIAQLIIIDALYVNVMMALGEEGQKAISQMRDALAIKRI